MPEYLFTLLAFLPILVLLVISIWKGVRAGIFLSFALTSVLFFIWDDSVLLYLASMVSALMGTVNIMLIIFGAVSLYQVMEQKGFINRINDSLTQIHPNKSFRFYFLAFFLTAFFESVAGFGTPGAIVPLLLISLGFPAIRSIAVVLLIDGFFAMAGAVGTPVFAGLEVPLKLDREMVTSVYQYTSVLMLVAGLGVVFWINKIMTGDVDSYGKKYSYIFFLLITGVMVGISSFAKELTVLISAIIMALISYVFFFKNKNIRLKPWIPYGVLVLLLLLPKVFDFLDPLLLLEIELNNIFKTEINASLQPLKTPIIPFLVAGFAALVISSDYKIDVQPILKKTLAVFVILLPSLGITQLMLNSGSGAQLSMIDEIAGVFVLSGGAYPILSPMIGVLGAFISGSTTVSNIIFGSLQYTSSQSLNFPVDIILSLQLLGASLGNAVCLFNIIAAGAVAGIDKFSDVLKMNLMPVVLASLIASGLAYMLIFII